VTDTANLLELQTRGEAVLEASEAGWTNATIVGAVQHQRGDEYLAC
jgi:hypothetical protein